MRRRIREDEEVGELNIVPYLDVVVNLVMFMLLSMTGLITLGVLNVSAPKIGGEGAGARGRGREPAPSSCSPWPSARPASSWPGPAACSGRRGR